MGKGIDAARDLAPEHAAVLDDFKDQLLIVLMKRLGGTITIPLAEVDDSSQDLLAFRIDPDTKAFTFTLERKQ